MSHSSYPPDLPVPQDDGACDHLRQPGAKVADVDLPTCSDPSRKVNLAKEKGWRVVFCYPRSGSPGETVPASWDAIPGARGCTPQACSYRDATPQFARLGISSAHIFGISTQSSSYQHEMKQRTHLPYELLSDEDGSFWRAMKLPTFEWEWQENPSDDAKPAKVKLIRRLTLVLKDGEVKAVWYPIFPPDSDAEAVVKWLEQEVEHTKAR